MRRCPTTAELQNGLAVGFVSLGCPKNLVDTEYMAGVLRRDGLRLAPSPEAADVVLVNTCAFVDAAKEEAIAAILDACALKGRGPCRAVIVTGCLPQRYGRALSALLPEVDAFLGVDQLDEVGRIVRRVVRDGARPAFDVRGEPHRLFESPDPSVIFTGGPYAYLKIAEGCDHRCRFCAIPSIRGRYRSRSIDSVVAEAERRLDQGARELILVSQDTTAYGGDRRDGASLARLMRRLDRLGGDYWVRWLYGHPARIGDDVLDAMLESRHVCRYLDLPVQHTHPDMLRAMGRPVQDVAALFARIRSRIPDAVLRTTLLAAYPGETPRHFRHMLNVVADVRFDHVGVLAFSPQEGTPAAQRADRPSSRTAASRRDRLLKTQRAVVREKARERIGGTDVVLLESTSPKLRGIRRGRSSGEAPDIDGVVRVSGVPSAVPAGTFVRVRYRRAAGYDLDADYMGPAAGGRNRRERE